MTIDTAVETLARRQHGLIADVQARELGATAETIRHRRRTGRWVEHRRGVHRLVGAIVTARLELLAASLATPGSVGSHQSAAGLHGLPGFAIGPPHLTVLREVRPREGVVLHESSLLPEHHVRLIDGIPCTSVARTAFDLCGSVHASRAERALDNALARRMVTLPAVQRVLDDLAEHGRSGTARLRALLDARGERYVAPESELEARFVELARAAGLPEPQRQVDVGDVDGWIGRVDFGVPRPTRRRGGRRQARALGLARSPARRRPRSPAERVGLDGEAARLDRRHARSGLGCRRVA